MLARSSALSANPANRLFTAKTPYAGAWAGSLSSCMCISLSWPSARCVSSADTAFSFAAQLKRNTTLEMLHSVCQRGSRLFLCRVWREAARTVRPGWSVSGSGTSCAVQYADAPTTTAAAKAQHPQAHGRLEDSHMTDTLNETKDTETTSTTPPEAEVDTAAFAALGLGADALRAIQELGFSAPTPIQEQTIPLLLAGTDVIAQAPTGTGKTAAYGLPIVDHLDVNELRPQALVVVPTRELSIQVAEALHGLGRFRELVTLPIYGGAPYDRQLRALRRGVQPVVGTPGRLLDHLNRGTLHLSAVRTVVLDEADETLNMGFIEDIEAILAALPKARQTELFSATIPPRIARRAAQYLHEPQPIAVAAREAVPPRVRQLYYEVPWMGKSEALEPILDLEPPESAVVFVRTHLAADAIAAH